MKALILGVTGQDGQNLAHSLVIQGNDVAGFIRRTSDRKHTLSNKIRLYRGDLLDPSSVYRAIKDFGPDVIFNEADQDNIPWSYSSPGYSVMVTTWAVAELLDMLKTSFPHVKLFQPVSATMFDGTVVPQTESSPFNPQSPYACAKLSTYFFCRHYREAHGLHVSTAIMYNHTSLCRSEDYLIHKVCASAVRISRNEQKKIVVGNLNTMLDIGWVTDYVRGIEAIMRLDTPDDFILSTGDSHSIKDIIITALQEVGIHGYYEDVIERYVVTDAQFDRPNSGLTHLQGDFSKASRVLGWKPEFTLREIIRMIVNFYKMNRNR